MTFFWDGTNSNGQFVKNGVYYVKVAERDQFGRTSVKIEAVQILNQGNLYEIRVFNSAGELVRNIVFPSNFTKLDFAPDRLVPADALVEITGDGSPSSGVGIDVGVSFPPGTAPIVWDGTNNSGSLVTSGVYTLQLVALHDNGSQTIASAQVQVIARPAGLLGKILAAPSPFDMSKEGSSGTLIFFFNPIPGGQVVAAFYNVAGELVRESVADVNAGKLYLQVGGDSFSSGVYIAVFNAKGPMGSTERQSVRFVIVK